MYHIRQKTQTAGLLIYLQLHVAQIKSSFQLKKKKKIIKNNRDKTDFAF